MADGGGVHQHNTPNDAEVLLTGPRPTSTASQTRRKALVPRLFIPSKLSSSMPDLEAGASANSEVPSSCFPSAVLPATPCDELLVCDGRSGEGKTTLDGLIPYNVPWGEDYADYDSGNGSLPGPAGACIFLRSPTPVEKRRTSLACVMCRERKAKCSGDRPACARCLARGFLCEYHPDTRRKTAKRASSHQLRDRRMLSHPYARRESNFSIASSVTDVSEGGPPSSYAASTCASSTYAVSPKIEEPEISLPPPPPEPLYTYTAPEPTPIPIEEPESIALEGLHQFPTIGQQEQYETYSMPQSPALDGPQPWPMQEPEIIAPTPTAPALHAPRPLRYSQSLPFLPSLERSVSMGDDIARPETAEPVIMTVDPRVLTKNPEPTPVTSYYQEPQYAEPDPAPIQIYNWPMYETQQQLMYPPEQQQYIPPAAIVPDQVEMHQYVEVPTYVDQNVYVAYDDSQLQGSQYMLPQQYPVQYYSGYAAPHGDHHGYPSFTTAIMQPY